MVQKSGLIIGILCFDVKRVDSRESAIFILHTQLFTMSFSFQEEKMGFTSIFQLCRVMPQEIAEVTKLARCAIMHTGYTLDLMISQLSSGEEIFFRNMWLMHGHLLIKASSIGSNIIRRNFELMSILDLGMLHREMRR